MMDGPPHLSPFDLDSLRLGRLDGERGDAARAHLAGCAACRRLEDGLRADQQRFQDEVLPRTREQLRARAEGLTARGQRWRRLLFLGVAPLVPAAALIIFLVARPRGAAPPEEPYLGIKGGAALTVVARRGGVVFPLASGAPVAPGDGLRFVVDGPWTQVMIVGVGGGGPAQVYVPFGGAASQPLPGGGRTELPLGSSVVLDGAPGPMRIFALFSRQPIAAAAALAAAGAVAAGGDAAIRATTSLPLAAAGEQVSVLLEGPAR